MGTMNYASINERLKLEERVTSLYLFINQKLDQGIMGSEEVVSETLQLEVIGEEGVDKVFIAFDQLLEVDEGKLLDGYYHDGFQLNFEKSETRTIVKLFGNYQANEEEQVIQFDKVIELETISLVIEVEDEGLYKYTEEGVIPISYLWRKNEEGIYFEIFE